LIVALSKLIPFKTGPGILLGANEFEMKIITRKRWLLFCFLLITGLSEAQTDVLTQHNDLNRTGWNSTETILKPSNVTPTNFGLLYKRTVDDQIYAQPLLVNGVMIGGVSKNVVFVATVNNTIYAFDADDGSQDVYWSRNFTPANKIPPNAGDIHAGVCGFSGFDDIYKSPNATGQEGSFGIIGTPVIDKASNTLYFVFKYRDLTVDNAPHGGTHMYDQDWSSAGFYEAFHAIDLSTGNDKFGPPVLIDPATTVVNGTGPGNVGGIVHFNPRTANQRSGLTLSNGIVYVNFAGYCDMNNYYGWVLGYQANNPSQQVIRYVTAPNSEAGGIWMSGAGPAVDASGNLFFAVGNGGSGSTAGQTANYSLSVVKAAPDLVNHTLTNTAAFQPTSYSTWNGNDLDFGTGVVLIPGSSLFVTAHKSSKIYLLNQNANSGKYDENNGTNCLDIVNQGQGGFHTSLTYFGGATTKWLYQFSEYTHVIAYPIDFTTKKFLTSNKKTNLSVPTNIGLLGGYLSVSSNGTDDNSGILWVTHYTPSGGALHALKASDITQELWNSDANPIDKLGDYAKMNCVTIANGRVYAPTFTNSLNVYGLLSSNSRCINNIALNKAAYASSENATNNKAKAVDNLLTTYWSPNNFTQASYIGVDLGGRFDICKIRIEWNALTDYGKNFTVDVSDDAVSWSTANFTTVETVSGNNFLAGDALFNEFNENLTARYVRISIAQQSALSLAELYVFGEPASSCVPPLLSSLTATNITQNTATLNWAAVSGAQNYIVKYRGPTVASYITKIIPAATNPLKLDIGALTCGFTYEFSLQTDCGSGTLSAASVQVFTTDDCTSPCVNFTRYSHGDLGDIKAAGNACFNDPAFTVTGAGSGIGSTGDQFQFNYAPLSKDEDYIMHIASQDPGTGSNQAGIMMRDSVTDISRFMYIGKTGNNQLQMIYRTTPGANAVTTTIPNPASANYFRILKSGTNYSAFYGLSTLGPWTIIGTVQNLNFGSQTIYVGMAVAAVNSGAPTVTSIAVFDNLLEGSTPLPVLLLNFTANLVQNRYVTLQWQTSMEENNDRFEIERSTDGVQFISIDTVQGAGNSSTIQSYSTSDLKPVKGISFYRLKQVDLDGQYSYSSIRIIKIGTTVAPLVYPNPVNSVFTAVSGAEPIREIVIYNAQGRIVQYAMGNPTEEEMMVNIAGLSTGMYILKIKTDSQIYQHKILKD
jgi:F5/8 type C domain/Secretion system C-terminal sorting domain